MWGKPICLMAWGIFNEPSRGCGGEETVLSSGVQSHVSEHITAGGMCVCVAKMQP